MRKKGIIIGAVSAGVILLGGGGWALGNFVILPEMRYKDAVALYEDEEFQKAKTAFEELGDYKDAEEMILACDYGRAEEYFDDEKFEKAKKAFDKLGDYEDAEERTLECSYALAEQQLEEGSHYEALEAFEALGEYEDAAERVKECSYEIGNRLHDSQNYDEACAYFTQAGDYEDAETLINACRYDQGCALYEAGDYEGAKEAFLAAGEYESSSELAECCDQKIAYDYGLTLFEQGNYQDAAIVFEELGDFETAESMADRCNYIRAISLYDIERYEEALEIFASLGDFESAEEYAQYCEDEMQSENEDEMQGENIEEQVTAESGQAYLAICEEAFWVQYWGNANDEGYMLSYGAEVATINGNGSYTVSVTTDTNGYRMETGGEYEPYGLAFCAIMIKDGTTLFPDAVITIDSIVVDGEEIEMTAKNYTSSDDGVELRSNIYNHYLDEDYLPEDAYSEEDMLYGTSMAADYSPQIIDAEDFDTWSTVEVHFTISGLE